jgi:iron complex outermembrane receptor protein
VLRLGGYVQDQISLLRSVVVVPGLRVSRLNIDDKVGLSGTTAVELESDDVKISPSLGMVVLPRPWLSLYASGTQGFEPPTPGQYLADGRALSLSDSTSFEGGVKADLLSGGLAATGSVYNIRRTNIAEPAGLGFYRQIGEGRSHGVEAEVIGRIAPALFVQGAYAWTASEITRSLIGGEGNDLPNAPHHNASLWTRYRFASGRLERTMLAAGVVYVSDRFLASNNVVIAPAYTRLDLSGSYDLRRQQLRIGVGVQNATNTRYVTSGANQAFYAGAARRLAVQVSTWF